MIWRSLHCWHKVIAKPRLLGTIMVAHCSNQKDGNNNEVKTEVPGINKTPTNV